MSLKLDIVFIVDVTGSMGAFISAAKEYLHQSASKFERIGVDARYSVILYRDHPPQDDTFASKIILNSGVSDKLITALNNNSFHAMGGGDTPESGIDAIVDIERIVFRDDSIRYAFLVGDAPLHGAYHASKKCTCGLTIRDARTVLEKMSTILIGIALRSNTHFDMVCDEMYTTSSSDSIQKITKFISSVKSNVDWAVNNVLPILKKNPLTTNGELAKMLNVDLPIIIQSIESLNAIGETKNLI